MSKELKETHQRCCDLSSQLESLFIFSSKLKHLQLSYQYYSKLVTDLKSFLSKQPNNEFGNEYYVMEIERCILEILTHICSIRDSLKNKILETGTQKYNSSIILGIPELKHFKKVDIILGVNERNERKLYYKDEQNTITELNINTLINLSNIDSVENLEKITNKNKDYFISLGINPKNKDNIVNGKLCETFSQLNDEHKLLLENTLDKDDFSKSIVKLTTALRNTLTHNTTQNTRCSVRTFPPNHNEDDDLFLTICDYIYLISKLKISDDITWHYLLDEHLIYIKYCILNPEGEQFREFKRRSDILEKSKSYIELRNEINISRLADAQIPVFDKLLKNKKYCLFSYEEANKNGIDNDGIYFDLKSAIDDIYKLHLDYYTRLHKLLIKEQKPLINELKILQLQLGLSEYTNTTYQRKYSCEIPLNKYKET